MGWDSSRSVPWERLVREWVLYAGIMAAIFLVFFRDNNVIGALAGVLISGPLYLAFGAVMAKFGYTRKNLKELRTQSKAEASDKAHKTHETRETHDESKVSGDDGHGSKPAPTSRTASGSNRPKSASKRKR